MFTSVLIEKFGFNVEANPIGHELVTMLRAHFQGNLNLLARVGNNCLVFGHYPGYDLSMSSQITSSAAQRAFPNTRWSAVLAAQQRPSPESAAAVDVI